MSVAHIELTDDADGRLQALFDPPARALLDQLLDTYGGAADRLLLARGARQRQVDEGCLPGFAASEAGDAWRGAETPPALRDRRVELFAPPAAEPLFAALDSGATAVTLDLASVHARDGGALQAQVLLLDLLAGRRGQRPAVVLGLRPLTRREPLVRWRGAPVPAALADLVLHLRHRGAALAAAGGSANLRLPDLDSCDEAALWADLLDDAANALDLGVNTLRVTLGIDTVHAVFAAEGMLHALRRYASALTFDRNACLRSFVHTFRRHPQFVLPDPEDLTTATHFLRCRGLQLIAVAHRRGVSALAPCLPWLPPPPSGDGRALVRLTTDLERLARDGFDGCGIVHPALLGDAREVWERLVPGSHQQHRSRSDVRITAADLLQVVKGKITERGMRRNLRIAMSGYLAARDGATLLDVEGRRETAASVALAADQLWQWVHHETGVLDDGRIVDAELFAGILEQVRAAAAYPADDATEAAAALGAYVVERQLPGEFPADLLAG